MIEDVVLSTQRYTRIYISYTVGREQSQREHHEFLVALREKKYDDAIFLLKQHIMHTQRALIDMQ